MNPPLFHVQEVELYERDVRLRLPFRFGVVTLTHAPQAFVRARIRTAEGQEGWGAAAEMLAPKWFDKNLALSNEENFEQLRQSLTLASAAYTLQRKSRISRSAFGHFAAHYASQIAAGAERGLNPLVAAFGPALIDRAVLDALARLSSVSFYDAVRSNLPGINIAELAPDLAGFDIGRFAASLTPAGSLNVRHTVGLVDAITAEDGLERVGDGLPETLEEVISTYGHRYFKLKVSGDIAADLDRLARIAAVLDRIPERYVATLDGNEQYAEVSGIAELWRRVLESPRLARLAESTLFIEQPVTRAVALERSVEELACMKPVLIDESDATLDAFLRAQSLGYTGVSSKACKGFYKSILNAARCMQWNASSGVQRYFMSAEDLTCQAGLAVQQDLALVSLLGLAHVERNGHHYVNGMAGLPASEQRAFLTAHPDLYEERAGAVRLKIVKGRVSIGSLRCVGFASAAEPEWSAMRAVAHIRKP